MTPNSTFCVTAVASGLHVHSMFHQAIDGDPEACSTSRHRQAQPESGGQRRYNFELPQFATCTLLIADYPHAHMQANPWTRFRVCLQMIASDPSWKR